MQLWEAAAKHFEASEVHLTVHTEVPSGAWNSFTVGEAQAANASANMMYTSNRMGAPFKQWTVAYSM